ncbi:DUF6276 family protein [Halobellus salinisoli]|uniref:DUF6276 family protein n=1 Tax=Halobellus salinisoli TaxID=3108500 RepID=UPI0030098DE4
MGADCPDCGVSLVDVPVPADLRGFAPDEGTVIWCCPRCLRTFPIDVTDSRETERDADLPATVPDGDGGVALLLLVNLLDSLALNRAAVQSLLDYAEASGTDVFLALDRLAADDSVDARVDLARRRRQLESMLDC